MSQGPKQSKLALYDPRQGMERARRAATVSTPRARLQIFDEAAVEEQAKRLEQTCQQQAPVPAAEPKEMPTWEWVETGLKCRRWTKSEARAVFKKAGGRRPGITVRLAAEPL